MVAKLKLWTPVQLALGGPRCGARNDGRWISPLTAGSK